MTEREPRVLTVKAWATDDGMDFVTLAGDLDSSSGEPLSATLAGLTGVARRVVVDVSELEFVDSSGVKMLVAAARAVEDAGGSFVLAAPTGSVRRVFQILHLDQVVAVVDNRSAAFENVTSNRTRTEDDG